MRERGGVEGERERERGRERVLTAAAEGVVWYTRLVVYHQLTCFQLVLVYRSRVVTVVALEGGLPVVDVLPKSSKFLKVDSPSSVPVKHPNHQTHRLRVEWSP